GMAVDHLPEKEGIVGWLSDGHARQQWRNLLRLHRMHQHGAYQHDQFRFITLNELAPESSPDDRDVADVWNAPAAAYLLILDQAGNCQPSALTQVNRGRNCPAIQTRNPVYGDVLIKRAERGSNLQADLVLFDNRRHERQLRTKPTERGPRSLNAANTT